VQVPKMDVELAPKRLVGILRKGRCCLGHSRQQCQRERSMWMQLRNAFRRSFVLRPEGAGKECVAADAAARGKKTDGDRPLTSLHFIGFPNFDNDKLQVTSRVTHRGDF
jgi:hypothetical protein